MEVETKRQELGGNGGYWASQAPVSYGRISENRGSIRLIPVAGVGVGSVHEYFKDIDAIYRAMLDVSATDLVRMNSDLTYRPDVSEKSRSEPSNDIFFYLNQSSR